MKKRIVLCADDYGQAQPISQGILSLVKANRISAVSCMVTKPDWQEQARLLAPYQEKVDIGLHFNLTEDKSSLPAVLLKANLRRLNLAAIVGEFNRQIDAFTGALGFQPQFIDGHQHVHQLPIVRDALIKVYQGRFKNNKPYIRVTNVRLRPGEMVCDVKKMMLKMMAGGQFTRLLTANRIPYNRTFSGIYGFRNAGDYQRLFRRFLAESDDMGLIMCHPGLPSDQAGDPIAKARAHEYRYLSSPSFMADCAADDVTISRFEG